LLIHQICSIDQSSVLWVIVLLKDPRILAEKLSNAW
jgi:hypothetical protein